MSVRWLLLALLVGCAGEPCTEGSLHYDTASQILYACTDGSLVEQEDGTSITYDEPTLEPPK